MHRCASWEWRESNPHASASLPASFSKASAIRFNCSSMPFSLDGTTCMNFSSISVMVQNTLQPLLTFLSCRADDSDSGCDNRHKGNAVCCPDCSQSCRVQPEGTRHHLCPSSSLAQTDRSHADATASYALLSARRIPHTDSLASPSSFFA